MDFLFLNLYRPEYRTVIEELKSKGSLTRYIAILEKRAFPRVHFVKNVPVPLESNEELSSLSIERLWALHEQGMSTYESLLSQGDPDLPDISNSPTLMDLKLELAARQMSRCALCERQCGVNRAEGQRGSCRVTHPVVSSCNVHLGEETELIPSYTIFFAGCNFHCVFCQNASISQDIEGEDVEPVSFAKRLQRKYQRNPNIRNLNWVGGDPIPHIPFILSTLAAIDTRAVPLPSVFNSNMYMTIEALRLLAGTQDLYLGDWKYGTDACALRLSKAPDYMRVVERNFVAASQQAEILIRHLVMPNHVECCTASVAQRVVASLGSETRFNLMHQYRPCFKAREHPDIARRPTRAEEDHALQVCRAAGLANLCGD